MSITTAGDFIATLRESMSSDVWEFLIALKNGETFLVSSEHVSFRKDFLYFDRIEADVKIDGVSNSGGPARLVCIPFSAIAYFTDQAS